MSGFEANFSSGQTVELQLWGWLRDAKEPIKTLPIDLHWERDAHKCVFSITTPAKWLFLPQGFDPFGLIIFESLKESHD